MCQRIIKYNLVILIRKVIMYITVLNFETSEVEVITFENISFKETTSELVEELLKERGYKTTQIQYMVSDKLNIKMT